MSSPVKLESCSLRFKRHHVGQIFTKWNHTWRQKLLLLWSFLFFWFLSSSSVSLSSSTNRLHSACLMFPFLLPPPLLWFVPRASQRRPLMSFPDDAWERSVFRLSEKLMCRRLVFVPHRHLWSKLRSFLGTKSYLSFFFFFFLKILDVNLAAGLKGNVMKGLCIMNLSAAAQKQMCLEDEMERLSFVL